MTGEIWGLGFCLEVTFWTNRLPVRPGLYSLQYWWLQGLVQVQVQVLIAPVVVPRANPRVSWHYKLQWKWYREEICRCASRVSAWRHRDKQQEAVQRHWVWRPANNNKKQCGDTVDPQLENIHCAMSIHLYAWSSCRNNSWKTPGVVNIARQYTRLWSDKPEHCFDLPPLLSITSVCK